MCWGFSYPPVIQVGWAFENIIHCLHQELEAQCSKLCPGDLSRRCLVQLVQVPWCCVPTASLRHFSSTSSFSCHLSPLCSVIASSYMAAKSCFSHCHGAYWDAWLLPAHLWLPLPSVLTTMPVEETLVSAESLKSSTSPAAAWN